MNWDTAPQELDALRAQVAALTKERDAWRQTCAHIGDELATHKTDAQRHLVEQLKSSSAWYEEQLAAAQAQIAQLKTALQEIIDCPTWAIGSLDMQRYREMTK
jgi:flagellar motility protein MotE (MotC chaperone)